MKLKIWIIFIPLVLLLVSCTNSGDSVEHISPASVEAIDGSELSRVILTERAAQRLAIETIPLEQSSIPYSAVFYDLTGNTWVYVMTAPLTFVRESITIESVDGDRVVLSDGPETGTEIVTVGVAELFGTESGVGQ